MFRQTKNVGTYGRWTSSVKSIFFLFTSRGMCQLGVKEGKTNLKMGIVGLPNVGKTTLFNSLTHQSLPAENFPFCTIDPATNMFFLFF